MSRQSENGGESHARFVIREATSEDVQGILDIYNEVIANGVGIYCFHPQSLETKKAWYNERRSKGFPVAVIVRATAPSEVCGFCSYGSFRTNPGYMYSIELSIHVAADVRGFGLGRRMMQWLIDKAVEQQYHSLMAYIDSENAASLALHRKFGFQEVGCMKEISHKFGKWRDQHIYQLLLPTPTIRREPAAAASARDEGSDGSTAPHR